jgi:hypothetical protein
MVNVSSMILQNPNTYPEAGFKLAFYRVANFSKQRYENCSFTRPKGRQSCRLLRLARAVGELRRPCAQFLQGFAEIRRNGVSPL